MIAVISGDTNKLKNSVYSIMVAIKYKKLNKNKFLIDR